MGVSHQNTLLQLSTSSSNQESSKIDKLLVSTSYTGIVNMGVSHINLINSIGVSINSSDNRYSTLFPLISTAGVSSSNFLQRNEIVLPSTFTNSSLTSRRYFKGLQVSTSGIGVNYSSPKSLIHLSRPSY